MAILSAAALLISAIAGQAESQPQPKNSPSGWITQDDYPPAAHSAGRQGDTGFRLDVDTRGRVAACTITASSGSSLLDETTCTLLKRRARFKPARDASGAYVAGHWTSVFRWRLG